MKCTRKGWPTVPAQAAAWYSLTRHDDPDPGPGKDPEPSDPRSDNRGSDDDPDPEGADQLGDAGKKALERMKAERAAARKEASDAKKAAADALKRVQEYEDRDKSELEKAATAAERASQRAERATRRAVKAEVKAAAADFADPEDAIAFLSEKLAGYTDDDGEIDGEAITSDLAELLERKPHLKRQAADPKPVAPKPDPGQGARPPAPKTDYRTAPREDFQAELAKYGVRLRS